jgi:hypothetical protein
MDATSARRCLARLCQLTSLDLLVSLWPVVLRMTRLIHQFTSPTPSSSENGLTRVRSQNVTTSSDFPALENGIGEIQLKH